MTVVVFPCAERREERLRGIEQCLDALAHEADSLGLNLLAHMIAVAREAATDSIDGERWHA